MIACLLLLTAFLNLADARSAVYGPCDVANNHLDPDSKAFVTDCDSFGYCAANGTCLPRQCRRDEYILASLLDSGYPVPPQCPEGSFCPDDASGCLPLVGVGGMCQLNRDDECAPPLNGSVLVVPSPYDEPVGNGVICLLGQCTYANATLGSPCTSESTTYTGYDVSGLSFTNLVVRDNCIEGQGYCDTTSSTCMPLLLLEAACDTDRQCQSYNCERARCAVPPESAVKVDKWVYAVTTVSLVLGMTGILAILILMHRRTSAAKRIMLEEYYREQVAYRNSIISFQAALSRPSSISEKDLGRNHCSLSETTLVEKAAKR
ncbi:hypothetical protein IAU60_003982 [Kwoniella sp. DSM 27419]